MRLCCDTVASCIRMVRIMVNGISVSIVYGIGEHCYRGRVPVTCIWVGEKIIEPESFYIVIGGGVNVFVGRIKRGGTPK